MISIITTVIIIGAVFGLSKTITPSGQPQEIVTVANDIILKEGAPQKGAENPKVTIVEFSDFECPACSGAAPFINQLVASEGENLAVVFRHMPLSFHKNAYLAAQVSEAAANQDKFWEMHNKLFATQKTWAEEGDAKDTFLGYAKDLELDMAKFEEDLDSQEIKDKISRDLADAAKAGVDATPTFFINGKKIAGFGSPEFNQLLQEELDKE